MIDIVFASGDSVINGDQVMVTWLLAYGGLRKNMLLIPSGLLLHAAWDIGYLYLVDVLLIPERDEIFCVVANLGLAGRF